MWYLYSDRAMKKIAVILILISGLLYQCQEQIVYPDVPIIDYENFYVYVDTNSLGQAVLTGKMNFSFTDGDGNIGFEPDTTSDDLPDSVRYNLFLQTYDYHDGSFSMVPEEDGGYLKYIIPYLDKEPLQGTITVSIEYPIIEFDTILYTFFLYDRDYNRSNLDTTDTRILYYPE